MGQKAIFENSEFPSISDAPVPVKPAPPKAPRRRKDEPSSSESSDDDEEDYVQQQHQRRKGKSKAKATPKQKQKAKKQEDEFLERESKKNQNRNRDASMLRRLVNYFNRFFKETYLGSGNPEILKTSPLGLPGKWTPVINLVWTPHQEDTLCLTARIRKNAVLLWPRYLEIIMFIYFVTALSAFRFFSIITIAQIGMSRIKVIPATVISLNHYLIWLLYFRELYNAHFSLKMAGGAIFMAHTSLFT